MPTTWVQVYMRNYDHLGLALLAVFECSLTELWLDFMFTGVDAVGIDMQPMRNFNRNRFLFFVIVIVVCNFFMLK